jgi:cyanophycinase
MIRTDAPSKPANPVRTTQFRCTLHAAALVLSLSCVASPVHAAGQLVIGGGALSDDNPAHSAFVAALSGDGPVVVIPAASESPAESGSYARGVLVAHGVPPGRVHVFPVAERDDISTPAVDESGWAGNAAAPALLAGLEHLSGVWFSGGDQTRIVRTLRTADGKDTPLLRLIRERHAAGAVVGGSSAGAAIMSEAMICGGDGFRGLLEPPTTRYAETEAEDDGRLYLWKGLGFFGAGIVDQHFDQRARLGRLVRALGETGVRRGFGIDEDTALVVSGDARSAKVVGSGGVTVLDAEHARFDLGGKALASGLRLSLFPAGAGFDLQSLQPLAGAGEPVKGKGGSAFRPLEGGGMAFPNPRIEQLLAVELLDNSAADSVSRYSIDSRGRVLQFRFFETPQSRGYWRTAPDGDRFTATAVGFDALRSDRGAMQERAVPATPAAPP